MELPPEIGPHEGRELALMAAGQKHVALFFDWRLDGFDAAVAAAGYGRMDLPSAVKGVRYITTIIYRPGYEAAAQQLATLVTETIGFDPAVERRIGEILSYTDHEIAVYLAHIQRHTAPAP
jgi:hypothetical protein